jgi:hypothetical protein
VAGVNYLSQSPGRLIKEERPHRVIRSRWSAHWRLPSMSCDVRNGPIADGLMPRGSGPFGTKGRHELPIRSAEAEAASENDLITMLCATAVRPH